MPEKRSILWDSCVLYRWLTKSPVDFVDHIAAHVDDAKKGDADIYISSMALAELRPSIVKMPDETPAGIVSKLCSFAVIIDTIPDIMSIAGQLKDNKYVCSTDHENAAERERPLSPGDAIQLASGIWMREYAGVQGLEFHTFDEGKRRDSIEGSKTVPMIGFHNWCKGLDDIEVVSLAKELKRKKPDHPLCKLPTKTNSTSSAKPPAS